MTSEDKTGFITAGDMAYQLAQQHGQHREMSDEKLLLALANRISITLANLYTANPNKAKGLARSQDRVVPRWFGRKAYGYRLGVLAAPAPLSPVAAAAAAPVSSSTPPVSPQLPLSAAVPEVINRIVAPAIDASTLSFEQWLQMIDNLDYNQACAAFAKLTGRVNTLYHALHNDHKKLKRKHDDLFSFSSNLAKSV